MVCCSISCFHSSGSFSACSGMLVAIVKKDEGRTQMQKKKKKKGLFQFFECTRWCETFKTACHATSNHVRGAVEAYLDSEAKVNEKNVRRFCAHSAKVSAKHYWRKESKEIASKLADVYHGRK